jgi:Predicted nucleic acid-binding protein, contains PIN domain
VNIDRLAWGAISPLDQSRGLTLYDAAYLELAKRSVLPLATLDRDLRAAAKVEGTSLLGM